jgi:hypothetical protein
LELEPGDYAPKQYRYFQQLAEALTLAFMPNLPSKND